MTPGFVYANANDSESLKKAVSENKCAAIMMEMIQGEGGVNPLTKEFVNTAAELAKEYDLLIVIDEVQTGNGRTGELYAYMNYGITPDIVTTAKGLGGGLPLGAAMLGEKVQNVFTSGDHGSTFGGNPVCCAGAVNILSRIDDELLAGVKERSKYIIGELEGVPGVKSITGMGLMLGIETERPAGDVINDAMAMGVLPLKAKNKVRLLPPLNISMDNLRKAIAILKSAIAGDVNI
jgi:acetylornithine/N-succinyldiaminopimelate aminotransferase